MQQWVYNIETSEAFMMIQVGNGIYSIENVEGRVESITTMELLTQYCKTGIFL